MELLFRLWRFVILLALGNLFLIACALSFDPQLSTYIAKLPLVANPPKLDKAAEILSILTASAFYLAIAGAIGVYLLDLVGAAISTAARKLVLRRGSKPSFDSFLAALFAPYDELAVAFLSKHRTSLTENISLINEGLDKLQTSRVKIAGYHARMNTHLARADVSSIMEGTNFFWVVTQDQFRAERLRDEINSIAVLWIIGPALVLAEFRCNQPHFVLTMSALAISTLLALSIPVLAVRRRRFAAVQMVAYLTQFQLSEAEVADRPM